MTVLGPEAKEEFRREISQVLDSLLEQMDNPKAFSGINPYALRKKIREVKVLTEEGEGWDETWKTVKETLLPDMLRTWSSDYMPHLHSPALIEAVAAELVIASYNNSMDSWDQGPVATEVEEAVTQTLTALYGYGEGSDGALTSGGSQSNFSAILAHRDMFINKTLGWDVKKHGLPESYRRLRLYTSELSHFSMEKSAHMLGLGYDAVVKLKTDSKCRIDIPAARERILSDKAQGLLPFCIVATIGTTDFGSIDSVEELRKIADEAGCYLHCDAAYGSGAVMSEKYRSRIGDLSLADSITVDFHKMFLLPISCSAVLMRDKASFNAFELHADYLNREEDEEDGYINLVGKSFQTTRRFDALKVFMSFHLRGKKGYEEIIDKVIGNASWFYEAIKDDDSFLTSNDPELSSVVFALKGGDELNKRLRRKLLGEGIIIGQTVYQGKVMLKLTLLNPSVSHEALGALIMKLKEEAALISS